MQLSFHLVSDPCYHYKSLSEASRNRVHKTPLSGPVLCDKKLSEGWYRLVGAAGKKCQQRMCQQTNVEQPSLAGCMVFILLWNMIKFLRRSALVLSQNVANTKPKFLWRTAYPNTSTYFISCNSVIRTTMAQTKYTERN